MPMSEMEMIEPKHKPGVIHSFGFSAVDDGPRGTLRVQFQNEHKELKSLGDYLDVPRSAFLALRSATDPTKFVNTTIKPYFEWRPVIFEGEIDPSLPDVFVIPASVPNTVEAMNAYVAEQRGPAGGLFT